MKRAALLIAAVCAAPAHAQWRSGGSAALEVRGFTQPAAHPGQHGTFNVSGVLEPEISYGFDDGAQSVTLRPFFRLDQNDNERTHFDIREAYWEMASDRWELRAGIRKVFWGVTESQHIVDIVNQTDLVENIDIEDKFGQPMINLALVRDWGTVDLFALFGFRERLFPGDGGRLRFSLPIDEDASILEAGNGNAHTDWALRYAHSIGDWELGLSHFYGHSREPRFIAQGGRFVPVYDLIHQTGADVQYTIGGWLWKLEAINRSGQLKRFAALAAGFEYTIVGIARSADLGVLAEYLHDGRGKSGINPFDNDLFAGFRLALNDEQSTEVLAGVIQDLDHPSRFFNVEASRRVGENWKLAAEGRFFSALRPQDPLFAFSQDDYIEIGLTRYF